MRNCYHIDFETRSRVDLRKAGADVYASDDSTSVLCMAYSYGHDEVQLWTPDCGLSLEDLFTHIESGGKVAGHNIAGFEMLIWNNVMKKYGWPELKIEQCVDTMALAYAMALPGSLKDAANATGLEINKDMKGHRIMLQLSQPRNENQWWEKDDVPEKFQMLYEYCKQDVIVERELHKRLMPLSEIENETWQLDYKINRRGVNIDVSSLNVAIEIVEAEKKRLDEKMRQITKGAVSTCTATGQLTDYLKWNGVETKGVTKAEVRGLLETDLPEAIRLSLLYRQEAGKTSTAKLKAMLTGLNNDSRVRGLFQYHGAGTGRWAGRRVQLQNLPRPQLEQSMIDKAFKVFNFPRTIEEKAEYIDMFFGPPMQVISDCVRGFIKAKDGHDFIGCDFSAIEARVLAWLANQKDVIEVFATHGKIYELAASKIFNVPLDQVTKEQRTIGKVAVLALGYQGGVGAFQSMAPVYGIKISDDKAEAIKNMWRENNPNIVRYWYRLEEAACKAVLYPGDGFTCGPIGRQVTFKTKGSFLWCLLPSKRVLCYPYPKLEEFDTPWGDSKKGLTYKTIVTNKWCKTKTYGGKLCENITQAVARDILRDAMFRLENEGYPIVMHVHDETVTEVPKGFGSVKEVERIMSIVPEWARGLPIGAEGWRGERFRK